MTASISGFRPTAPVMPPSGPADLPSQSSSKQLEQTVTAQPVKPSELKSVGSTVAPMLIAQNNQRPGSAYKDFAKTMVQGMGPNGRVYKTILTQREFKTASGKTGARF